MNQANWSSASSGGGGGGGGVICLAANKWHQAEGARLGLAATLAGLFQLLDYFNLGSGASKGCRLQLDQSPIAQNLSAHFLLLGQFKAHTAPAAASRVLSASPCSGEHFNLAPTVRWLGVGRGQVNLRGLLLCWGRSFGLQGGRNKSSLRERAGEEAREREKKANLFCSYTELPPRPVPDQSQAHNPSQ